MGGLAPASHAAAKPRVVSINTCTDQLVLALADPEQIAGLSRFAKNPEVSYLAAAAARYPSLLGSAEEIFRLKPAVVLASPFSGRATRDVLVRYGVRVETFAPPATLAEATAEVARAAGLLGQEQRGAELIARISDAAGRARAIAANRPRSSGIALHRRGFIAGTRTLLSAVLSEAGIDNAAGSLGIDSLGQISLEGLIRLSPDLIVLEGSAGAPDQGAALLRHQALAKRWPVHQRIVVPIEEIACAGPSLPVLIDRVSSAVQNARSPP